MTAHDHKTSIPGCYRCELSKDEAAGNVIEDKLDELSRFVKEHSPHLAYVRSSEGYALVRDDHWAARRTAT